MARQNNNEIQDLYSEWIDNPTPLICTRLSERLRSTGRSDEALEVAKQGIEEWPTHISIWVVLGRIHLENDNLEEATVALENVRSKDPFNLIALKGLAEAAFKRGKFDQCSDLLEEYLLEQPGDEEVKEMLTQAKLMNAGSTIVDKETEAEERESVSIEKEEEDIGDIVAYDEEDDSDTGEIFPETERMSKILEKQSPMAKIEPLISPESTVSDEELSNETSELSEVKSKKIVRENAETSSIDTQRVRREPRSLLDLFTSEEQKELNLKPYNHAGEKD